MKLESLLRDQRWQMRHQRSRTKLEYFQRRLDEEREIEPRPEPARVVTPPLQAALLGVESNSEGERPSEEASRGNGGQNANLPPLLAAHIGRSENGQPFQSSLTSVYKGALSNNIGRNLPPNAHGLPFANSDRKPSIGEASPTSYKEGTYQGHHHGNMLL
ncbi:hypothetical protein Tco_1533104 [Tanacetum coccineum]